MLDIKITKTTHPKEKPQDESKLGFGKQFSDHMFLMDYTAGEGWHDARIVPYGPWEMDPATTVFHYAQEIFEGMKAYRTADGKIQLFRPDCNANRFNDSADRLGMPPIPPEDFVQAVKALVDVDRDLAVIPSVAIHMNRAANDGFKLMANVDTLPLYGMQEASGSFRSIAAKAAGVQEDEVLGEDLSLYVRTRGTCLGAKNEFILAPRLDDLGCVFGLLEGFLAAKASGSVPVFCAFDNEEVGSETKQGAASSLLSDTLRRIALALGLNEEGYLRMLAQSFLVSADNAHGVHPNHPEYADMTNTPRLNGGVVIKFNANQRYTTDGVSCALFTAVCREAGAPVQVYANRSDMPGGSTLGSIATTKVSVPSVDIGLAQLAMHSCVETAGAEDLDALVKAMTCYYGKTLKRDGEQITF